VLCAIELAESVRHNGQTVPRKLTSRCAGMQARVNGRKQKGTWHFTSQVGVWASIKSIRFGLLHASHRHLYIDRQVGAL
jgi:hypothetical protein